LQQKLPGQHIEPHYYDLQGMAQAIQAADVGFVITNPGHYVALEYDLGISRIATQVPERSRDGSPVLRLLQQSRRLQFFGTGLP